jgi:hypothetical protein
MVETARLSETLAFTKKSTRRLNLKEHNQNLRRHEEVKL